MSVKVSKIINLMERLAPNRLALGYDNIGLIMGDPDAKSHRVLVALDLDDTTANEAIAMNADLVITHHPAVFKPIKKITGETAHGRRIMLMIKNGVSVYAAHTNLDIARLGTNDALFDLLELSDRGELMPAEGMEGESLGRTGLIKHELTLKDFCFLIKEKLGLGAISYAGNPNAIIHKVGLCTGSASDEKYLLAAASKNCDAYITGDVTYHNAQAAVDLGIAIIDGTHFATEVIIIPRLVKYLKDELAGEDIEIHASRAESALKNI